MEKPTKKLVLDFKLLKPAKRKGGDKYVCSSDAGFNIYFPQSISRQKGVPAKELQIKVFFKA